jgi:hypothetical protein
VVALQKLEAMDANRVCALASCFDRRHGDLLRLVHRSTLVSEVLMPFSATLAGAVVGNWESRHLHSYNSMILSLWFKENLCLKDCFNLRIC